MKLTNKMLLMVIHSLWDEMLLIWLRLNFYTFQILSSHDVYRSRITFFHGVHKYRSCTNVFDIWLVGQCLHSFILYQVQVFVNLR